MIWFQYTAQDGKRRSVRVDAIGAIREDWWITKHGCQEAYTKLVSRGGSVLANVPIPYGQVCKMLGMEMDE